MLVWSIIGASALVVAALVSLTLVARRKRQRGEKAKFVVFAPPLKRLAEQAIRDHRAFESAHIVEQRRRFQNARSPDGRHPTDKAILAHPAPGKYDADQAHTAIRQRVERAVSLAGYVPDEKAIDAAVAAALKREEQT